jgi:CubicO group peptidase (beta-lactamase class C family)
MIVSRRGLIAAAAGAPFVLSGCQTSLDNSADDEIDRVINGLSTPIQLDGAPFRGMRLQERMARYGVPGVSICRFRDGEITWARGFGQLSADSAQPIDANTLFQAASVSKPITAALVMNLVQSGVLDLDADVQTYLRDWNIPRDEAAGNGAVTLRMLLSHTAGVSVSGFRGYAPDAPLPTLDDIIDGRPPANHEQIRIVKAPGGAAEYSGGGYLIAQRIIEWTTGRSFAELARERVLARAGMNRSLFAQPLLQGLLANAARAHDGEGRMLPGGFMVCPELAPAGLWSTPTELAHFAIAYLRAFHGGSDGLISPASARTMATRQEGIWAAGFELIGDGEPWAVYHTGSNLGYKTFLLAELGAQNGAIVMTNGDNGGSLFQEILAGMAVHYGWPHLGPRTRTAIALSNAELQGFAAVFRSQEPIVAEFVITVQEGQLIAEVPGFVPATEFFPRGEDTFFDLTGSNIRFERSPSGRVEALSWDGNVRAVRTSD